MDYNEKLYNVFSNKEHRLESWMAAVFSKEYDHNVTIDELKEILAEENSFIVTELKEVEKENYIRENSKWEVILKAEYIEEYDDECDDECDSDCSCEGHECSHNHEEEHQCSCGHHHEEEHQCSCSHGENHQCSCGNHDEEVKQNDELTFYIALIDAKTVTENVPEIFSVNTIKEENYKEALEVNYAIHISTVFQNYPLTDYQRQLQLLNSIVADASLFLDMSCSTARSGDWLAYTATFPLLPSLDYLYTIHAIYDDDKDPNKVEYWFHTHGLYRAGVIELEIVGVEDSNAYYGELLNTVAKLFIERGVPEKGFKFTPAYGVSVCWLPWQEALEKLNIDKDFSGSYKDRNDNIHNTPSGVLVAVDEKGNCHTMDYYKDKLTDNPIFMLSNFETAIMREAAFDKIEYFIELLTKKKKDEDTSFLVKLGYAREDEDPNDLEHLWFEVHDFTDDGYFDATLINEPYKDLNMHEGDRGMHSIENLTDWIIYYKSVHYDSKNIYLLFED